MICKTKDNQLNQDKVVKGKKPNRQNHNVSVQGRVLNLKVSEGNLKSAWTLNKNNWNRLFTGQSQERFQIFRAENLSKLEGKYSKYSLDN